MHISLLPSTFPHLFLLCMCCGIWDMRNQCITFKLWTFYTLYVLFKNCYLHVLKLYLQQSFKLCCIPKYLQCLPTLLCIMTFPFFKKKKKDFIYLFMRGTQREAETLQREKQAPCGESDAGLNPRTLGS